jgi:branched-chain amino acid transport system permease protein
MHGEPTLRTFAGVAVLLALGFALPLVLPEYFLYLGNTLMMYAILALGLDLLLGWSGQFAFAHIAFFGIGIYTSALLQMRLGVPFILGVPIAALFAGFVGLLIALPATRLRTVYLALATYAFAECAQWVFRTWDAVTKGSDGLRIAAPDIFGYVVGTDRRAFPVMAIMLAAVLVAMLYLTRSKLGRELCAIRDSEHVASASGIDVAPRLLPSCCLPCSPGSRAGPIRCTSRSSRPTRSAWRSSSWCSPWWWSAAPARSPAFSSASC